MSIQKMISSLVGLGLVLSLFAGSVWGAQYTVTDLGTLGGTDSRACDINSSGQVVGYAQTTSGTWRAFRTAANMPINSNTDDLGTLGGTNSKAYGINDQGQVVGEAQIAGNTAYHAFRTNSNQSISPSYDDLGMIGGTNSTAFGINNNGQVVGGMPPSGDPVMYAYRTAANCPIDPDTDALGSLGGSMAMCGAMDINDKGQVVGWSTTDQNLGTRAFRTAPNSSIDPTTDNLGVLGGNWNTAIGINAIGQVVGSSEITGGGTGPTAIRHAFCTAPNSTINPTTDDIGTLGGRECWAYDVNDKGQVVGWSYILGNTITHAFLYTESTMTDLNDLILPNSGWVLTEADGINNTGQIVGSGTIGGQTHAFLLTPVPEPSSLILLGIGMVGMMIFRWPQRSA